MTTQGVMKMAVYKHNDRKNNSNNWYYDFVSSGKRHKKSGFKTKNEAQAAESALRIRLKKMENGEYEIEDAFSVSIQAWHDGRRKIADNTRAVYQTNLDNHIKKFFGNRSVNSIKPTDVQDFLNVLYADNLKGSTVRKMYNILNKYFNDMVRSRQLSYNPCSGIIEKPSESNKKATVFDRKELMEFLKFAETHTRYAFAFWLAANTGMRRGEILALRWSDVDFENDTIRIHRRVIKAKSGTKDYVQEGTKTSDGRRILISEKMKEHMLRHKEVQQLERTMSKNYEDNDLLICTQDGKYVLTDNLSKAFSRTLKASGIKRTLSLHSLRHTHATLMLEAGVPMKAVSERLGHSNFNITMNVYAHLLPSMEMDAMQKFERLFE